MSVLYYLGLMQWVILKVSPNAVAGLSHSHLLTGLTVSQNALLPEPKPSPNPLL